MSAQTATKEKRGFQAETKQLLNLMINSLYSSKEIFLRELISNASDAANKLRFAALSKPDLYEDDPELKVKVTLDKDARTVTIIDNGIGMDKEDLISNLGTIAKSGTKDFLNSLTGDAAKDSRLIGQFGVGFYSAFIVADKITVRTRKAGVKAEQAVKWESTGDGEFELEGIVKASRGTEIELHLKETEDEFLNSHHLRQIITKYSDHIDLPVIMHKELSAETEDDNKGEDIIDVPEEEVVNKATALWTRPRQEITDEEYIQLYKAISYDFEAPLTWAHNKVEGKLEYTSLLYIPARAPFDLFMQAGKARGLKLYVNRVFIMDESEQFLPNYLRFVKGILDSNDLPLNVSREILQNSNMVDSMRAALTKRVLGMLEAMAKDNPANYQKFWLEFGQVLKEGPAEDFANKDKIAALLRFASTNTDSTEQTVSLDEYISRMPQSQDTIYYVAADTHNAAKSSPHLEVFRKKSIEVLLLSDKIDEWLMSHLTEFSGKNIKSVARGDLELGELEEKSTEEQEMQAQEFKDTLTKMQEILQDSVKEVRITKRLTESPACIVTDANDMTPQMERLMRSAGQAVPKSKPILELNPQHLLVAKLDTETDAQRFGELTQVLFDQAILAEGGQLDDPASFVKTFNKLLLEVSN